MRIQCQLLNGIKVEVRDSIGYRAINPKIIVEIDVLKSSEKSHEAENFNISFIVFGIIY